jgi:hypothetical protein
LVWKEWHLWNVYSWHKAIRSGSSTKYAPYFYCTFSGFLEKWTNSDWKEPLRRVVNCYIEGNNREITIECSLILLQTGLELLCSVGLSKDEQESLKQENKLKQKKIKRHFKDIPFGVKLEGLLTKYNVSLEVPAELSHLKKLSLELDWKAPRLLARLRNNLTHSDETNLKQRFSTFNDPEVQAEAKILSLWYTEILLLRLCGYQGDEFSNFVQLPDLTTLA